MGVLANHVPSVEALRPGVIEVIEENGQQGKKWFVSAGFATVHGNNSLTINAVEAYPLDKFSLENIKSGLADANRVLGSNAPESEKAVARIEVDVYEGLQAALSNGVHGVWHIGSSYVEASSLSLLEKFCWVLYPSGSKARDTSGRQRPYFFLVRFNLSLLLGARTDEK
ncbi:F-type H+-transporting ATPase subunit delta [Cryptococcus deuterogattii 99/473]|uniref:ATP synthase subunit delta, mitochondrial n=1 Tax=Cryptococcus deuterogattii Ram5 TaxID=1296110 RepID=A0A0D0UTZ5_9TREE|nr:F-type H+-transporting ATPase subunit delta [Cryptococcus deuterogattii LA55]KIR31172.1 F-type H+-transporting ATPase subunit delta [Cryptococcus deuterogattii MMRL2647]KIR37569.1 F-type H+-transporting ATPase subunit delta [Cryptococcus deuterogattii Ram5]KIR69861.1 F-type H+-transporting ATPase subunit delta [Cryptococcus deuterogattii CA1014]KIR89731.1 F-type H+-transporting ATPase subunit delta [Cryptococcus deuterogattii CBS 10090]KIR96196.1 F-type H+-transporting ATPase subunit delta 